MKFVPKSKLTFKSMAVLTVIVTMVTGISLAAPNEPPPPSPPGPVPPGLPIDNGIVILMLMAVIFGYYKIQQIKHKKAQM